jgi:hypothetical protein
VALGLAAVLVWGAACGDDGLTKREEGEMIVRANGSDDALFVSFASVGRGFRTDSSPDIEVANGGTATVTITGVDVVTDSTGYITPKTSIPQTPFTIEPDGVLNVKFQLAVPASTSADPINCPEPTSALPNGIPEDQYCGQVTFRTNARQGAQATTVYLLTNQQGGTLEINPTVVEFNNPLPGQSQTQRVTLRNASDQEELSISNIYMTNVPTGFDRQFNLCGDVSFITSAPLGKSEAVECEITFTPEQTDEFQGQIVVESDDANNPMKVISVRVGAGTGAQIEVDPDALDFPNGAETQNFNVVNNGIAALLINDVRLDPSEAEASYTVGLVVDGACTDEVPRGTTIGGRGGTEVLCVTYEPNGGPTTATVEILSNATNVPNGLAEVSLSAGQIEPAARLDPANMIFDAEVGESASREFAIINEGQAALEISGYELQGNLDAEEFEISPDPAGVTVAPGALTSFTLTDNRREDDVGLDQGAIVFLSNNPVDLTFNVRNNIQAEAIAPVADIVQSPDNPVAAGTAITLDGAGSSSETGIVQYYTWTLLDRPTGSAAELPQVAGDATSITFTPDVAGSYRVQLVVTSDQNLEGSAVREITVE